VLYAGADFSLENYIAIRTATPIPDIFDYSLTEGRDIFAWAQQCCAGQSRGIETVVYELDRLGVPMNLDAPTVTGQTWRQRLSDTHNLAADSVTVNPIVVSKPRRMVSGIDVLRGNWLDSAVVKISGLPDQQLNEFDEKVAVVVYFENEEEANRQLLDVHFLESLESRLSLSPALMAALHRHNGPHPQPLPRFTGEGGFAEMVKAKTLKLAVVISGQGPEAYGMPEMATSMLQLSTNRALWPLVSVISDGRYSGVTYGAAIGHVTPEAIRGGGILYLRDGDLLHLRLRKLRMELLDRAAFAERGEAKPFHGELSTERKASGDERLKQLFARRRGIAPSNLLVGCTDASRGVVPAPVAQEATEEYVPLRERAQPVEIKR